MCPTFSSMARGAALPRRHEAVEHALLAVFLHAGRVCSAGTRLLVQDSVYDSFVAEVARRAELIRSRRSALPPRTRRSSWPVTLTMDWPEPCGPRMPDGDSGWPHGCATARCGLNDWFAGRCCLSLMAPVLSGERLFGCQDRTAGPRGVAQAIVSGNE